MNDVQAMTPISLIRAYATAASALQSRTGTLIDLLTGESINARSRFIECEYELLRRMGTPDEDMPVYSTPEQEEARRQEQAAAARRRTREYRRAVKQARP